MNRMLKLIILSVIISIVVPAGAMAAGIAVGTDIIRHFDKEQDRDGQFNAFAQFGLNKWVSATGTYASGEYITEVEGGIKVYLDPEMPYNGVFLHAAAVYYEDDRWTRRDSETGFMTSIGYEMRVSYQLIVSGECKAVWNIERSNIDGDDDTVFSPVLRVMLAF